LVNKQHQPQHDNMAGVRYSFVDLLLDHYKLNLGLVTRHWNRSFKASHFQNKLQCMC